MSNCEQMASVGKFNMMDLFDSDLLEGPEFIVQDMEQPQLIDAANCQIVTSWMKSQGNQRIVCFSLSLYFEVKHSQKFTSKRFVIPHSDCRVFIRTSRKKWSLLANVHPCNRFWVESFVKVFKVYLLFCRFLYDVRNLRNYFIQIQQCDVIIRHWNEKEVFFLVDWNVCDTGCTLKSGTPFPGELKFLWALRIAHQIFLLGPQTKFTIAASENESPGEGTDTSDGKWEWLWFVENIMVLLPDFINIGLDLFDDQNFTFVSGTKDLFLRVPWVFSDLAIFWELSDVFQRFEGILLNFEQFYCRASA